MRLIVGLGNPGTQYDHTRHNVGFRVVRTFHTLRIEDFGAWKHKGNADISEGRMGSEKTILMLPTTFMNDSGDAVIDAVNFWKIRSDEIVMVYDDLDLPLGTVRIRKEGGSGGHNGVRSIIGRVGTDAIARIRIGIGNDMSATIPAKRFVLEKFRPDESEGVQTAIDRAAEALQMMLQRNIDDAMNEYNERA